MRENGTGRLDSDRVHHLVRKLVSGRFPRRTRAIIGRFHRRPGF